MAGFEFGEELVALKKVEIGTQVFKPGDDFLYEDLAISTDLVEKLLDQRFVARKSKVNPALMNKLLAIKVAKKIRNHKGMRIAVSWPYNEDLPAGVLDGRVDANKPSGPDSVVDFEEEKPAPKKRAARTKVAPRKRAKTTLKKDFE